MYGQVTGDDIFSWILMLRNTDNRAFLLLEGAEDLQALDHHLDQSATYSVNAFGKMNALRATQLADEAGLGKVLAIVDRDWDDTWNAGLTTSSANIFYTDHYDLDSTILAGKTALERLITAHADPVKVRTEFAFQDNETPFSLVAKLSAPVGYLRFLSILNSWGLNLKDFPIQVVVDHMNLTIDVQQLSRIAIARSRSPLTTETRLNRVMTETLPPADSLYYYCTGHDMCAVLSTLLRNRWNGVAGRDTIGASIRSMLSCELLKATKLYTSVARWAEEHNNRIWSCEDKARPPQ